jgi:hypothetical protein
MWAPSSREKVFSLIFRETAEVSSTIVRSLIIGAVRLRNVRSARALMDSGQ